MRTVGYVIGYVVAALLIIALCMALGGGVLWLLWNAVVPAAFHGPHLSFWHATLLALLLSVTGGMMRGNSASATVTGSTKR